MARDHARLYTTIWNDPDFTTLQALDQLVYLMLLSNPDLSYAGVVPWFPPRYTHNAADLTPRKLIGAAHRLTDARLVLVDETSAELLVRSYVRHDGLLRQPNVAKAMVRAWQRIHSPALREAVTTELVRAYRDDPDLRGWHGIASVDPTWIEQIRHRATATATATANPSTSPSETPTGKES